MFIGFVVNPKLARPVGVKLDRDKVIDIIVDPAAPGASVMGSGSYDDGDYGEQYAWPAELSGYPRVHTPEGVKEKKKGYGTALYAALCLGAHLNHDRDVDLDALGDDDDGICSADPRSPSAQAWWNAAKQYDLAEAVWFGQENVDLDVGVDDLACVDLGAKRVSYVNYLNVDVETSIDVMTFYDLASSGLAVASIVYDDPIDELAVDLQAGRAAPEEVWVEAAEAIDVREMPEQTLELIARMLEAADESHVANVLRLRHLLRLDPTMGAKAAERILVPNAGRAGARAVFESLERAEALREAFGWRTLGRLP